VRFVTADWPRSVALIDIVVQGTLEHSFFEYCSLYFSRSELDQQAKPSAGERILMVTKLRARAALRHILVFKFLGTSMAAAAAHLASRGEPASPS
jgi:hypothetical protein